MRSEPTVAELLSRTELFGRLEQGDRARVVRQMRHVSFRAGQAIFSRGDPGDEVYLVLEGRVRLSVVTAEGRTISYRHACAGSIFGEIAALDRGVRTADATALTFVMARTLAQRFLDALIRSNPGFARATIEYVCKRLRETSEQVEGIALHSLEARVARFLLSGRERRSGGQSNTKFTLDFAISQAELALLVGGSRQKVNSALARLEAVGAIDRRSGKLVCDVRQLVQIADREEA